MRAFILRIKPAISLQERCKIEDLLETLGYKIIGSGTMTDGSSCDISFEGSGK